MNLKVTQAGVLMQSMAQKACELALVSSNLTNTPDWTSTALKRPWLSGLEEIMSISFARYFVILPLVMDRDKCPIDVIQLYPLEGLVVPA